MYFLSFFRQRYVKHFSRLALSLLILLLVACGTTAPEKATNTPRSAPIPTPTPSPAWGKSIATLTSANADVVGGASVYDLAYSPDSRRIAYIIAVNSNESSGLTRASETSLSIWQIGAASPIYAALPQSADITGFAWSPKSNVIAVATRNKGLVIINGENGSITKTIGDGINSFFGVAWSPDGSQIAASVGQLGNAIGEDVQVYDAQSGTLQFRLHNDPPYPTSMFYATSALAWSSDKAYIAATTINTRGNSDTDEGVSIWNVATHQHIFLPNLGVNPSSRISFQPGTDILAQTTYTSEKGYHFVLINAATAHIEKTFRGSSPSWAQDGKHVVYLSYSNADLELDTIDVFSTSDWSTLVYRRLDSNLPKRVAWAPDGHTIAVVEHAGTAAIVVWGTMV